jgi:hypothetical protein
MSPPGALALAMLEPSAIRSNRRGLLRLFDFLRAFREKTDFHFSAARSGSCSQASARPDRASSRAARPERSGRFVEPIRRPIGAPARGPSQGSVESNSVWAKNPRRASPEFRTGEARSRAGREAESHPGSITDRRRARRSSPMAPNSRDFAFRITPNTGARSVASLWNGPNQAELRSNLGSPIDPARVHGEFPMWSGRSPKPALNGGHGFRIVNIRH